jgi:hypothetical protein
MCPGNINSSLLISGGGSAPSQWSDANGFATGRFGRWSLEHGRRQFEVGQETLEEFRWKNFARQTGSLDIKYKYRHCSISMPVFDSLDAIYTGIRKMGSLAGLHGQRFPAGEIGK